MLSKNLVYKTMYISIIVQIITSLVSLHGLFVKLEPTDRILKDILGIETFVQFVETFTYIWIIMSIRKIGNMTPRRYFDWMITTPIMLISTIIYMDYMYKRENEPETSLTLIEFLRDNRTNIVLIFVLNALMLLFGYMGETGRINKYIGIPLGFMAFFAVFYIIYHNYAVKTQSGKNLFYFVFGVWFLYGIAAMFPGIPKNISYNILDIIAKNFYGLFIYYKILQLRQ
jgi:hypothetical protein